MLFIDDEVHYGWGELRKGGTNRGMGEWTKVRARRKKAIRSEPQAQDMIRGFSQRKGIRRESYASYGHKRIYDRYGTFNLGFEVRLDGYGNCEGAIQNRFRFDYFMIVVTIGMHV